MPKIGKRQQRLFMADDDMVREIEEFRFAHRYKSESAAVRDIIRAGLDALQARDNQTETEVLRAA